MQFQVPQFIETEDKIVGPFTLKQFAYVGGAAGISFILYFTVQTWLWLMGSVLALSAGLGFAFLKVNGRSLPQTLLSATRFFWQPQIYTWHPDGAVQRKKDALGQVAGGRAYIERIISGLALKTAWENVQTGAAKKTGGAAGGVTGRYQIFTRLSGERAAARRVDYR